jgi:hypothetical protein
MLQVATSPTSLRIFLADFRPASNEQWVERCPTGVCEECRSHCGDQEEPQQDDCPEGLGGPRAAKHKGQGEPDAPRAVEG